MDDLISRQGVIDAITEKSILENMDSVYDTALKICKRSVHRIIASQPSVQPEIIRCRECKQYLTARCPFGWDLLAKPDDDFYCAYGERREE